jgi:hypothetical protein
MNAATQKQSDPPALVDMPPEILCKVGRMLFVADEPIFFKYRRCRGWKRHRRARFSCKWRIRNSSVTELLHDIPQVWLVNKKVFAIWRAEFYTKNEFQLDFEPGSVKCFARFLPYLGGLSPTQRSIPRIFVFEINTNPSPAALKNFFVSRVSPWKHKTRPWNHKGQYTVKLRTSFWVDDFNEEMRPLKYCREHKQSWFVAAGEMEKEGRLRYTVLASFDITYWHNDPQENPTGCKHCSDVDCKSDTVNPCASRDGFACGCRTCIYPVADAHLELTLHFVVVTN